jgi:hypothetical protein
LAKNQKMPLNDGFADHSGLCRQMILQPESGDAAFL